MNLDELVHGRELRGLVTNLARLREAIPDFPTSSLMTVPPGPEVAYAGIDWKTVHRLNQEAQASLQAGRITDAI